MFLRQGSEEIIIKKKITPEASLRKAVIRIEDSPGPDVASAVCCVVIQAAEKEAVHHSYTL